MPIPPAASFPMTRAALRAGSPGADHRAVQPASKPSFRQAFTELDLKSDSPDEGDAVGTEQRSKPRKAASSTETDGAAAAAAPADVPAMQPPPALLAWSWPTLANAITGGVNAHTESSPDTAGRDGRIETPATNSGNASAGSSVQTLASQRGGDFASGLIDSTGGPGQTGSANGDSATSEKMQLAFAARLSNAAGESKDGVKSPAPANLELTPASAPAPRNPSHEIEAAKDNTPAQHAVSPAENALAPTSGTVPAPPAVSAASPAPVRAVEAAPEIADIAPTAPSPLKQFSVRIPSERQGTVDIRFADRGGDLRVWVRAQNPELASSLQQNVADLASSLEGHGLSSEIWTPVRHNAEISPAAQNRPVSNESGGDPGDAPRQDHSGDAGQYRQRQPDTRWPEYFEG